jgi:hypothetical protein
MTQPDEQLLKRCEIRRVEWPRIIARLRQLHPGIRWNYEFEDKRLTAWNPWDNAKHPRDARIFLSWDAPGRVAWHDDTSITGDEYSQVPGAVEGLIAVNDLRRDTTTTMEF